MCVSVKPMETNESEATQKDAELRLLVVNMARDR